MRTNRVIALLLGTGLLLASLTVVAHHSVSAEFDTTKKVTFTGTVKSQTTVTSVRLTGTQTD